MAEPLLALDGMRAGYGDAVVLDDISFEVPERGSLAVLGRNGVGKTHAAAHHHGLHPHRRGTIVWRGKTSRALPRIGARATGIGWVAQEREIFPPSPSRKISRLPPRPGRWDLDAVYELVPAPQGAARQRKATSSPAASSRCWRSRAR